VGIADGSGTAEDPQGLSHVELLRLFEEAKPIVNFSRSLLSSVGEVFDAITEEGAMKRNTMHNRLKSDIFVPGGGRPNTINGENWKAFIDESGTGSSPLIVEGANLFLTSDARERLFREAKVAIVKDSSANKCGVIASSCEVAASMVLSEAEFMSIKEELVADVLVKLRTLARLEAELLFREYKNFPGALPFFSERISMAISTVTDAITNALEGLNPGDQLFDDLFPLVIENLPAKVSSCCAIVSNTLLLICTLYLYSWLKWRVTESSPDFLCSTSAMPWLLLWPLTSFTMRGSMLSRFNPRSFWLSESSPTISKSLKCKHSSSRWSILEPEVMRLKWLLSSCFAEEVLEPLLTYFNYSTI
jgi:hypothetical protein